MYVPTPIRFASIRGWTNLVYSDPGSQLVNADKELKQTWREVDERAVLKCSTDQGYQWIFGPANSPCYQGAAEARGAEMLYILNRSPAPVSPQSESSACFTQYAMKQKIY